LPKPSNTAQNKRYSKKQKTAHSVLVLALETKKTKI
jgi:hypothetical protein